MNYPFNDVSVFRIPVPGAEMLRNRMRGLRPRVGRVREPGLRRLHGRDGLDPLDKYNFGKKWNITYVTSFG